MKTRTFNLTAAVRDAIEIEPMISANDLFLQLQCKKGIPKIKRTSFNSSYYPQRKKVHTRTLQRTTGFKQSSPNTDPNMATLELAAEFIKDVGNNHAAVNAVQLLAKLMQ